MVSAFKAFEQELDELNAWRLRDFSQVRFSKCENGRVVAMRTTSPWQGFACPTAAGLQRHEDEGLVSPAVVPASVTAASLGPRHTQGFFHAA